MSIPKLIAVLMATWPLLVAHRSQGTDPSPEKDEEDLAQIQQELVSAWIQGRREVVDRILAPDWIVTNAAGQVVTKSEVMRDGFETGMIKIRSGKIDQVRVRLFGDAAVVTGRNSCEGLHAGKEFNVQLRFTDVFVKRKGVWQAVAHATRLQS